MKFYIVMLFLGIVCISSSHKRVCKRNRPVCSSDRKTFQNVCLARRAKAAVKCRGHCPCEKGCECSPIIQPVCGSDGKTYGNVCAAKSANTTIECYNRCPCSDKICMKMCPNTKKHVCGYVGSSYRQKCLAYCQSIFEINHKKVIYKNQPGPCKSLAGADSGSEDMTTLSDGTTLISSGLYHGTVGRLLLFDFKDPSQKVTTIEIDGNIPDFQPHGMSVWANPGSDMHTVMVVSHGKQEKVEFFEYMKGSKRVKHKKSILTGDIHLNNVVATSDNSFYGTQDSEYGIINKEGSLILHTELFSLSRRSKVWYFNGKSLKQVAAGFLMANGINISPDKQYLYVADFTDQKVLTYKINADNSLQLIKNLYVGTGVDNIEVDPKTGDLWIGCHPRLADIYDYHFIRKGKGTAPSQVLKIKTKNGVPTSDITEVFMDDGNLISASTVASYFEGKLLIGAVGSILVLCEVKK